LLLAVVVEVFAAVEEVELQLEEDEEGSEEVLAEVEVSLSPRLIPLCLRSSISKQFQFRRTW